MGFRRFLLYLVFINSYNIIAYDLGNHKTIAKIENAHNDKIEKLKYYSDEPNKKDLIISIAYDYDDYEIKLWNVKNFDCLLSLKNIYIHGQVYSSCIISNNNEIFLIPSV